MKRHWYGDGSRSTMADGLYVWGPGEESETEPAVKEYRIAAYCRVSTDLESQETSIRVQEEAFRLLVENHPGWVLTGIYTDRGSSGLRASSRPGFMRMMRDALDGKFDRIIVKSVSRFARNTVDLLDSVRTLKEKGVYVWFDEQGLDSADPVTELILTIHASFAQEESRSLSENCKRGIRSRFAMGIPKNVKNLYALEVTDDGRWQYRSGEEYAVRMMFFLALNGFTLPEISDVLNDACVPDSGGRTGFWNPTLISLALHNEKYMGDVVMQKTYSRDMMSDSVKNDSGALLRYWLKDHHEALVSREDFIDVQYMLLMRDLHRGSSQYPYYGFLRCPYCGGLMVSAYLRMHRMGGTWFCMGTGNGSPLQRDRSRCPRTGVRHRYLDDAFWQCFDERRNPLPDWYDHVIHRAVHGRFAVSYTVLKRMVAEMTFTDRSGNAGWDFMQVTWLDGEVTRCRMDWKRPVDIPVACPEFRDGRYHADGRDTGTRCGGSSLHAYEAAVKNAEQISMTRIFDRPEERLFRNLPELGTVSLPVVLPPGTMKEM